MYLLITEKDPPTPPTPPQKKTNKNIQNTKYNNNKKPNEKNPNRFGIILVVCNLSYLKSLRQSVVLFILVFSDFVKPNESEIKTNFK